MHAARVPPLVFSLSPQVRSLRQLDELMRQLVKVVPRAEISALSVPQLATLAVWGLAFSALGCATHSGRALKPPITPRAQGPGGTAAVLPPWPGHALAVRRAGGGAVPTQAAGRLSKFETSAGETYELSRGAGGG